MKQYFAVGTYTEPILFGTGQLFHGKGEGLYLCSFENGKICVENLLRLQNPSFFCIYERKKKIYAVNETKEFCGSPGGGITEISYNETGEMEANRSYCTGGADPCHIAVSPDGTFVAVANFASGSVTAFPLSEKGEILPERDLHQHVGSSVHPVRQRAPHAHSIIFDPCDHMLVPDLGTDQLYVYSCVPGGIAARAPKTVALDGGSGPRYGEFSADGRHFCLINEIASSVTHFLYEDGRLRKCETVSTLPEDFAGDNICSDLHLTPDGRYLYASNRGHDSLTAFRVDPESGVLTLIERISCGGKTPRNFCIDPSGAYLLVGNQESDSIVVFAIGEDGRLREKSRTEFPSPVCIRFFIKNQYQTT